MKQKNDKIHNVKGNNPVYKGPPGVVITESYNGSTWTEVGDMGTGRYGGGGAGTQTNALTFGGAPPAGGTTVNTESFDGTSWTEVNNLGTNRYRMGDAGSATDAFAGGGNEPPAYNVTEEWLRAAAVKTVTTT